MTFFLFLNYKARSLNINGAWRACQAENVTSIVHFFFFVFHLCGQATFCCWKYLIIIISNSCSCRFTLSYELGSITVFEITSKMCHIKRNTKKNPLNLFYLFFWFFVLFIAAIVSITRIQTHAHINSHSYQTDADEMRNEQKEQKIQLNTSDREKKKHISQN